MPRELTFALTLEVRSRFNRTNSHLIVQRTATGNLSDEGPARLLRLALDDLAADLDVEHRATIKARFDELLAEVKADREAMRRKVGGGEAMPRKNRY